MVLEFCHSLNFFFSCFCSFLFTDESIKHSCVSVCALPSFILVETAVLVAYTKFICWSVWQAVPKEHRWLVHRLWFYVWRRLQRGFHWPHLIAYAPSTDKLVSIGAGRSRHTYTQNWWGTEFYFYSTGNIIFHLSPDHQLDQSNKSECICFFCLSFLSMKWSSLDTHLWPREFQSFFSFYFPWNFSRDNLCKSIASVTGTHNISQDSWVLTMECVPQSQFLSIRKI